MIMKIVLKINYKTGDHMKIVINGDVYISDYGRLTNYDSGEDSLIGESDCCCDECEFDCNDENEFLDPLEELVEEYTELLSDECICSDYIREILTSFVYDLINEE